MQYEKEGAMLPESVLFRDLHNELVGMGLSDNHAQDVLKWTEELPIKILDLENTYVHIDGGVVSVEPNITNSDGDLA